MKTETETKARGSWFNREKIIGAALIALLALGALGATGGLPSVKSIAGVFNRFAETVGFKHKDTNLKLEHSSLPTPTPQLSKKYIYAGSRMLAIEDYGIAPTPPPPTPTPTP